MASFALITEGITDQAAINSILNGLYDEEPDVREVQPIRDATDEAKQGNPAGWERVLEYCTLEEFAAIFSTNDYAIIQIDTDVCGHVNFPIGQTNADGDRPQIDLISDVKTFIASKIHPDIFAKYAERIFYAICVHSLECWILPLYSVAGADSGRIKSCEGHLERALRRKDFIFKKDYRTYETLTKPFLKKAGISLAKKHCESFNLFVESLPVAE
jgi:hypothetical protein